MKMNKIESRESEVVSAAGGRENGGALRFEKSPTFPRSTTHTTAGEDQMRVGLAWRRVVEEWWKGG